jgi:long-subunit acyl-CoA synthetase (AMP-forming)
MSELRVDEVVTAVKESNTNLSRVEQIKRFTLVASAWEPGGDELTPTMKLERSPIAAKYAEEIVALYTSPLPDGVVNVS